MKKTVGWIMLVVCILAVADLVAGLYFAYLHGLPLSAVKIVVILIAVAGAVVGLSLARPGNAGAREKITAKQGTIIALACVFIVACFTVSVWYMHFKVVRERASNSNVPTKCYYAYEDGSGVFVDDVTNIPPFDHNGRPAYRALLYKGADGKPFVQHLETYDEDGKKDIEKKSAATGQSPMLLQHSDEVIMHKLIRRPDDPPGKWTKQSENNGKDWVEIMTSKGKNGSGPLSPVSVEEGAHP